MAYLSRAMLSGETILYQPRFSAFAAYGAPTVELAAELLLWQAARWLIMGPIAPESVELRQALFWLFLAGLAIFFARFVWRLGVRFIRLVFSELAVTNRRYMEKSGILDVAFWSTDIEKIVRVAIDQPLLGRFFNYGDITIVTIGEVSHTTHGVADPLALQQAVHARMAGPPPAAAPRPA